MRRRPSAPDPARIFLTDHMVGLALQRMLERWALAWQFLERTRVTKRSLQIHFRGALANDLHMQVHTRECLKGTQQDMYKLVFQAVRAFDKAQASQF